MTVLSYSGPHWGFSRLADETVHVCSGVEAIVNDNVPFFNLFKQFLARSKLGDIVV